MPQFPSSLKRPSLWAWIGFAALVIVTVGVIKVIFHSVVRDSNRNVMTMSSGASDMYAYQKGAPVMGMPMDMAMEESAGRKMAIAPMPPGMDGGGSAAVDLDGNAVTPRIIKTGNLSLRVTDAPKTVENVRALVTEKKGFVESSTMSDSGSGPRSAWMTLRVPVTQFDATMTELKAFAALVLNESVNGQDVTMEFVDLEADLRNAKAEEASYLEILKRSGDIEDVLAVTRQLAEVRGRIERIDGRKRFLENRTDLATISVSLTEDTRIEAPSRDWRPLEVLRAAVRDLIVALQELVNFLIRLVIAVAGLLLPIGLFVWFVIWLGWKIVKAVMRKMKK